MVFKIEPVKLIKYFAIVAFLGLGWFGGWWDELASQVVLPKTAPAKPAVPSINVLKTKLVGWDKNQKAWEITAKRIWQSADGNITYFEKIDSGVVFSVEGEKVFFKGGWARWEKPWSVLYMGGFITVTIEQHVFKTKEAEMRVQSQEIKCEYPIEFKDPDVKITAEKMIMNLATDEVKLTGNVMLTQDQDRVTSKSLLYTMKDQQYQLLEPGGITIYP